jgi:L-ascorbate metabolism protein UlaG (beta-lactamase superfamily)
MALEITWLGRSCFRLKGREGTVVCDPCPPDSGYKVGKLEADVATFSRRDELAFGSRESLKDQPIVLDAPGEYEVGGVLVTGIGIKRPDGIRTTAFIVELDGIRVAHLGVPAEKIPEAQLRDLETLDVILLPVGGHSTLTPAVAADVMTTLDPKLAIPMLYWTEAETMELEPLESFLKETGAQPTPQPRISVTRSSLPAELTVVVLEPRA